MLCRTPDWRWELAVEESSGILNGVFGRAAPGDWGSVVDDISNALRKLAIQVSEGGADKDE